MTPEEKFHQMTPEERFRRQSAHYLPCFIDRCERHATCMHWLVGQQTVEQQLSITSVNPMNPQVSAGQCPVYQENQMVLYAKGLVHLLDDIPYKQARNIKQRLISLFGRKHFYEYRNGSRLIPPADQQHIARVCHEEGYDAPLRYDGWEEDFLW